MQLDETSTKVLIFVKDNSPASTEDIYAFISNDVLAESCIISLIRKNYIKGLTPNTCYTPKGVRCVNSSPYAITADGLAYLENYEKEQPQTIRGKITKWLKNNALEIIAIIISIIALLKP